MSRSNISEAEYQALLANLRGEMPGKSAAGHGKIPHRVCVEDGFTFDSKAELTRYRELKLLVRCGYITALRVHTKFGLVVNGEKVGTYECDFEYVERGARVVEDVKSEWTRKDRHYRRARKLMLACHGIEIQEVIRRPG